MKYKIISNFDKSNVNVEVNEELKKGWELFGSPFSYRGELCQAMTKSEARPPEIVDFKK